MDGFLNSDGGNWLWWLGPFFMVFLWGLVIAAVVLFIRRLDSSPRRREDSALEMLEARYFKGEIGKEEFEEQKRIHQLVRSFKRVT